MTLLTDNRTDWNFDENFLKIVTKAAEESLKYENFDPNCEISLSFVTNSEIHKINKQFRNIDRETDVLSFPNIPFETEADFSIVEENCSDYFQPDSGELILGDIILSVDRICSQAESYGHSRKREFAFLVAHSMLHLCGYDHETPEEAAVMEQKQETILSALGLTRDCLDE